MLVVVGNTAEDLFLTVARFAEPGESRVAEVMARGLGGKGANQAVAAARTGAKVSFVTAVGSDEVGQRLATSLEREPFERVFIHRCSASTDMSFIQVAPDGQNLVISTRSCALGLDEHHLANLAFGPGDTLLTQANLDLEVTERLICQARNAGAYVALNPSPTVEGLERLVVLADLLILNEREAEQLGDGCDALQATRAWIAAMPDSASWPREAVVTLGPRGAEWLTGEETLTERAPPTSPRDTTGAGDVLCGVLLARRLMGADRASALRDAVHAASASTTRIGTFGASVDGLAPGVAEREATTC